MYEIASLATDSRAVYPSQGGLPLESKALEWSAGDERALTVMGLSLLTGGFGLIGVAMAFGLANPIEIAAAFAGALSLVCLEQGAPRDFLEAKRMRRLRALCVDLGKHYGLKLSWSERHRLADIGGAVSSDGELRVFGSITRSLTVSNGELTKQTIYLIWADGRLQLAESKDGERFSELRRPFPSDPHELRSVCGEEKPL